MTTFAALLAGQAFVNQGSPITPNAPSVLIATAVSATQINLSWTDNSTNELNFTIFRSTNPTSGFASIATVGADVTSYSNTGLDADTTYYYRIKALGPGGSYSDFSNTANATTESSFVAAPYNPVATAQSDVRIIGGALAAEAYDDGAKIYFSTVPGGPYTLFETVAGPIGAVELIEFNATGLSADTTYYFVFKGIAGGVESDFSAEVSETTLEAAQVNYVSGFNNSVSGVVIDSSGDIYCCGAFTSYNGTGCNYIVKLHGSGVNKYDIDTSFNYGTGLNSAANGITIDLSGKILVWGNFSTYRGTTSNGLARIATNGTIDAGFLLGSDITLGAVFTVAEDSNNKIYVGGSFTTYKGGSVNRIVRLLSDGTEDTGFTVGTGFNNEVYSIRVDASDNIYVGGAFTQWKGVTNNRIIKINSSGTKDATFDNSTGFSNWVQCISLDSAGDLYCAGTFLTYKGTNSYRVIKLSTNGSIDTSFDIGTGFIQPANSIYVDNRGGVIICGVLSNYDGGSVPSIVRLSVLGVRDTTFIPNATTSSQGFRYNVAENAGNSLFIGGTFSAIEGQTTGNFVKLNFY